MHARERHPAHVSHRFALARPAAGTRDQGPPRAVTRP